MKGFMFDKNGFLFFLKFVILVLALFLVGKYGFSLRETEPVIITNTKNEEQSLSVIDPKQLENIKTGDSLSEKLTLGFVGDIMLDRGVKSSVMKNGNGDYIFMFEKIKDYLNSFDILFGNLEGPISDGGINAGSIYSFRMDPLSAKSLKEAGFDVLSIANNHIGDWGKTAIKDTIQNLENVGIAYVGGGNNKEEAYQLKIIETNKAKISFLAFSQFGKGYLEAGNNIAGIAIISDEKLKFTIEKAKSESDIVIVSFHFGDEYREEPNDYQKTISHKAVDYGADLVIGHHPHVVERIEKYKDRYIAYSLGNFVFDQYFSKETMEGMALKVMVENKKITEAIADKIILNKYYQPELATNSLDE